MLTKWKNKNYHENVRRGFTFLHYSDIISESQGVNTPYYGNFGRRCFRMKKNIMKLMAIILTVAMLCSMFPTFASAAKVEEKQSQEISAKSEAIINADIWDKIDSFEDENIVATRGKAVTVKNYAELSDEIVAESSEYNAVAKATGRMMCEVVADEYGCTVSETPVPM